MTAIVLAVLGLAACLPALTMRLLFLAPTRLGAIPYYSNVFSDMLMKSASLPRGIAEVILFAFGFVMLSFACNAGWYSAQLLTAAVLGLEITNRALERRLLTEVHTHVCSTRVDGVSPTQRLPNGSPAPYGDPKLVVNMVGPFVGRSPQYDLGDIVVGRVIRLKVHVGNHSILPTQDGGTIQVSAPTFDPSQVEMDFPPLKPGDVHCAEFSLRAGKTATAGRVAIVIASANQRTDIHVRFQSIQPEARLTQATITRYPGATRSAFAWRGDMDLYDTSSFQDRAGLENTLGMAARYRMPQTMFVSTRLTFDMEESKDFFGHFRVDRGQREIADFVEWFRNTVSLRHRFSYPFSLEKPYAIELGNHGHLHYGTDTSASKYNNFRMRVKIGATPMPWVGEDKSSFGEQRDNALKAKQVCEELFNFSPKSWAMPNRTNDRNTARAMEAAGCEVVSDSNVRARHNVIVQPPPHHPTGTAVVELTKRYPGDLKTVYHFAMNLYWLHRGHRLSIPVVFMAHQHLVQYAGYDCIRLTEQILRYVLTAFNGDFYVDTVYGVGVYWKDFFSPKHRVVKVRTEQGKVLLQNEGDRPHHDVPVDIRSASGAQFTVCVDLPERSVISIDMQGGVTRIDDNTAFEERSE